MGNVIFLNTDFVQGYLVYQISQNLEKTHDLIKSKYKRYRILLGAALLTIVIVIVFLTLYLFLAVRYEPFWTQSLIAQASLITALVLFALSFVLFQVAGSFSFEKRVLLKIYKAYTLLERFVSLSGVPTQDKSDLKNTKKIFIEVSKGLTARKEKNTNLDLSEEANKIYFELGKLIQTKILFLLEEGKRFGLAQQHILDLLNLFAYPKFNKMERHISVINTIEGGTTYQPRRGFLEKNQGLVTLVGHACRLGICFIIVFIVGTLYSNFFEIPISSIAPHMLTSTFALFAAWEFKSK